MYCQFVGFYNETYRGTPRQLETTLQAKIDEVDIPYNDIYTQDYFLFAYSKLSEYRKGFLDSKEGYTYLQQGTEERISSNVLTFLNVQRDMPKFRMKITRIVKAMKENNLDDHDTGYVDVDLLLQMYLEEFRTTKRENLGRLSKYFKGTLQENEKEGNERANQITFANVTRIISEFKMNKQQKTPTQFLSFAGHMCAARALMYAMMCGRNGYEVSEQEFLAGCNRFGIDNPLPI